MPGWVGVFDRVAVDVGVAVVLLGVVATAGDQVVGGEEPAQAGVVVPEMIINQPGVVVHLLSGEGGKFLLDPLMAVRGRFVYLAVGQVAQLGGQLALVVGDHRGGLHLVGVVKGLVGNRRHRRGGDLALGGIVRVGLGGRGDTTFQALSLDLGLKNMLHGHDGFWGANHLVPALLGGHIGAEGLKGKVVKNMII